MVTRSGRNQNTRQASNTTSSTANLTTSTASCIVIKTSSSQIEDKAFKDGATLNTLQLNFAYRHLPQPQQSNNVCCAIHNWVTKDKTRRYSKGLAWCPDCRVHLCMKCYSRFHQDRDLLTKKDQIEEEYRQDNIKPKKK